MPDQSESAIQDAQQDKIPSTRTAGIYESGKSPTYEQFLDTLAETMPRGLAECAAVSVLCALTRRITAREDNKLLAQLPPHLGELLVPCTRHTGLRTPKFDLNELYAMVADDLERTPEEAQAIVRDVFSVLRTQISEGEARDIGDQLPQDILRVWKYPGAA
jgi:uncharacterized protein (DUF2267 family)